MATLLMVLAGTLLPVMSESISNARVARARDEAAQISTALVNFRRDVGSLAADGATLHVSLPAPHETRAIDVLISNGLLPRLAEDMPPAPSGNPTQADRPGRSALQPWTTLSRADALDAHLRVNLRRYPKGTMGPGTGWNGPYLSTAVEADPWGHAYLVNGGLLCNMSTPPEARTARAVFVLSAGPNGTIETPFVQPVGSAHAFGDDIIVRIQ
jgi:hypothetical protein